MAHLHRLAPYIAIHAKLYPQNGERIVTIDSVTPFHPVYIRVVYFQTLITERSTMAETALKWCNNRPIRKRIWTDRFIGDLQVSADTRAVPNNLKPQTSEFVICLFLVIAAYDRGQRTSHCNRWPAILTSGKAGSKREFRGQRARSAF